VITVVTAPACHFCFDAEVALAELSDEYALDVRHLEAADPVGRQLVQTHGVGMFPLVLVDGQFFSQGRLPRRKLCALLSARVRPGETVDAR
jgi:hypothetical protein